MLSIIIVNWNVSRLLEKCLFSIYQHTSGVKFEVFVVDNCSSDESIEMVKQKFPQVKLIQNSHNFGFAKANNIAIRQAKGEFILLLNPDTELIDNSLSKMMAYMQSHFEIGILAPKLLHSDMSLQKSIRRWPYFWDQFLILLKVHNFLPNLSPLKRYYAHDFDYQQISQVEQIMGAVMLIRSSIFKRIGLLDERFWLLFEEVDFCKRTSEAGVKIIYYPDAQIIHHKGESFSRTKTIAKQLNFNHNLFLYFKKHRPFYELFFLWLLQPISVVLAAIDEFLNIKAVIGKNKDL